MVHTTITHNTDPPGDLLVFWVHTKITRLVISWSFGFTQHWTRLVHTTITRLVISWPLGFTLQSPAMWSPGPLGWHKMKSHDCSLETRSMFMCWDVVLWQITSFLPAAATLNWELHTRQNTCDNPLSLLLTQSRSVTHTWRYFRAFLLWKRCCHVRAWFRLCWYRIN